MSDYTNTYEDGDIEWMRGLVDGTQKRFDPLLSIGRAQRLLNGIEQLEADNGELLTLNEGACQELVRLQAKLSAVVELPRKWRNDSERHALSKDRDANYISVGIDECIDELEAAIKGVNNA